MAQEATLKIRERASMETKRNKKIQKTSFRSTREN